MVPAPVLGISEGRKQGRMGGERMNSLSMPAPHMLNWEPFQSHLTKITAQQGLCSAAQVLVPCCPAPCATMVGMTLPQPRKTLFALGINPFPPLQLLSAGNPASPVLVSPAAATPKLGSFRV